VDITPLPFPRASKMQRSMSGSYEELIRNNLPEEYNEKVPAGRFVVSAAPVFDSAVEWVTPSC